MRKKFAFLWCLAIAIQVPVSQATTKPKFVSIGTFTYIGTGVQPTGDGSVSVESTYELRLETTGITTEPISFGNAILFVKGTRQGSGAITTGPGCGPSRYEVPCDLIFLGGARSAGLILAPCARLNEQQDLTQDCVSIAMQLVSLTGKNFSFALANGEEFCAYGINNIFLLANAGHAALEPRCNAQGFCKGASVPIVLRAAPAKSCSQ